MKRPETILICLFAQVSFTLQQTPSPVTQLTVCLVVERNTKGKLFYDFDRSRAAVDLAIDYANDVILPDNIRLATVYKDAGPTCPTKSHVVPYAMDLMEQGITCDVYIGPGCGTTAESLHDLASHYTTLMIGCPAAGVGIAAPLDSYQYLARISVSHINTASTIINFLRKQRYLNPTMLLDQDNSFYQQLSSIMASQIDDAPDLYLTSKLTPIYSSTIDDKTIRDHLNGNVARSRVFILLAPSDTVRSIMIVAQSLGMTTGPYVFVAVNLFSSTTWGNFSYNYTDGHEAEAAQAYRSVLMVSLDLTRSPQFGVFASSVVKLSQERFYYNYTSPNEVDIITGHFYDSVILYGSMVRDLAALGANYRSGTVLSKYYPAYNFSSPVNGIVSLYPSGDRISTYVLNSFDPDKLAFGEFLKVALDGSLMPLGSLQWPDGGSKLPPNRPYCGFLGEDQRCVYRCRLSDIEMPPAICRTALSYCRGDPTICGKINLFWTVKETNERRESVAPLWPSKFEKQEKGLEKYLVVVSCLNGAKLFENSTKALAKWRLGDQWIPICTKVDQPGFSPSRMSHHLSIASTTFFAKMPKSVLAAAVAIPTVLVIVGVLAGTIAFRRYANSSADPFWWRIFEHELIVSIPGSKSTASSGIAASTFQSKATLGDKANADAASVNTSKKDKMSIASVAAKRATYQGNLVGMRELSEPRQRVTAQLGRTLAPIRRIQHQNLQKFYGIAISDENMCEFQIGELCSKGSLSRLLYHDHMGLDWNFNCALFKDLTSGMSYLHLSSLQTHGNLSSHSCLIDSNFVMKIADYGMGMFRSDEELAPIFEDDEDRDFDALFWRSPELLRQRMPPEGTQKGDVYSYAIILQQIVLRTQPFRSPDSSKNSLAAKELLLEVKKGTMPPLRPRIPISACPPPFIDLVEQCWDENPFSRPPFVRVREMLLKIVGKAGDNVVDHLIRSMERHAAVLEHEADVKMREFMEEKRRSDDILSQILPKSVAMALTKGLTIVPETFSSTTVHFSDVDGFTQLIAEAVLPRDTIAILNSLYHTCDTVIEKQDVYKVETVKDAYLVVSGLPIRNGIKHAGEIATMGLVMRREITAMKISVLSFEAKTKLRLRVGIHSGPCVSAVIGTKMPRYCLFGDTVNTSSRMESHGEAGKIQLSPPTKELLDKIGGYICFSRGEIEVKGKGIMETFWLVGKDQD